MRKSLIRILGVFMVLSAINVVSFTLKAAAEASCVWTDQTNGCKWGTCVDDNGSNFCQQCCSGNCSNVNCSS